MTQYVQMLQKQCDARRQAISETRTTTSLIYSALAFIDNASHLLVDINQAAQGTDQ